MQDLSTAAVLDARYAFVTHAAGRTHYQRLGAPDAPLVLMVSGATLPMGVWEPLLAPLLARGLQVLRYDLPGRGQTPLEGQGAGFDAHLLQLRHLIAGLGIRQPVCLVGLASGALVVAEYAQAHPAQVAQTCLIAPDGAATRFTMAERLLCLPILGTLLFRLTGARTLLARVPRYSSRADVQAFVSRLLAGLMLSPGFRAAVLATVRTFPLHGGLACYRRLAQSGIPTRIIWGRADHITPPLSAHEMAALFGAQSVHILEGVGHLPFVEDPQAVAAWIEPGNRC